MKTLRQYRSLAAGLAGMLVLMSTGCAGSRDQELEKVARDWSLVIRASQVIPVYPLTEDVQPGDIFLVDRPIQQQHKQYMEDGFLPLDSHVCRLQPSGYESFYERSFAVGNEETQVPKFWLAPGQGKDKAWLSAPQAGFPSYSFSVKRGGGFNAALPINGVPIGLTLLGSDAADGSITIDKAKTYGVDLVSLHADVTAWAQGDDARAFLLANRSTNDSKRYLRIITRVYLTGRMIVQLNSAASTSFGASGGAPKPVELLTTTPNADPKIATAEQYGTNVEKLNELLARSLQTMEVDGVSSMLPGATVKVVAASARSITMAEDFIDRPLVIGYLGFDLLIDKNGNLGFPTATRDVLERGREPMGLEFSEPEASIVELRKRIQASNDRDAIAGRVVEFIGGDVRTRHQALMAEGETSYDAMARAVAEYLGAESGGEGPRHEQARRAMQRALQDDN